MYKNSKTQFKKGNVPWNKNKKDIYSENTIAKMSLAKKGKPFPGIRYSWTGKKHTEETKRKMGLKSKGNKSWFGKKLSKKHRHKLSKSKKGEKNPNWMGGISENPYPKEFNSELKLKIRKRDNFICCLCGRTEREELEELNRVLCINHINFDKNDCKEENLNTLCLRCNIKINKEREYWISYFNQLT